MRKYTKQTTKLQQMVQKLANESENQGLKMNKSKTKVMMENDTPIYVNNTQIEKSYTYLGQRYNTREKNQDKEIQRRITAGWTAFAKHRDIFKGNIGICVKRQIYNSCVLSAMTYSAETWTLTSQAKNKLAAAQTKYEKVYVKHHMPGQKNKHLDKRKDKGHRHDRKSQKTGLNMGSARKQETR